MVFGGITVGCGLPGTIGGGLFLDYVNSTLSNAFKLPSASAFFEAVFCFSAFCFKKEILFLVFFLQLVNCLSSPLGLLSITCACIALSQVTNRYLWPCRPLQYTFLAMCLRRLWWAFSRFVITNYHRRHPAVWVVDDGEE